MKELRDECIVKVGAKQVLETMREPINSNNPHNSRSYSQRMNVESLQISLKIHPCICGVSGRKFHMCSYIPFHVLLCSPFLWSSTSDISRERSLRSPCKPSTAHSSQCPIWWSNVQTTDSAYSVVSSSSLLLQG